MADLQSVHTPEQRKPILDAFFETMEKASAKIKDSEAYKHIKVQQKSGGDLGSPSKTFSKSDAENSPSALPSKKSSPRKKSVMNKVSIAPVPLPV